MEQEHKRRVRYAGTHPRTFQEKYKELNPEKYQQEVEKLLHKGKTPAGMHIPICVEEILSFLEIQPGQIGLDATLGYGGHSRRMLEALQGKGHLYATDVDPIESEKTRQRLEQAGVWPGDSHHPTDEFFSAGSSGAWRSVRFCPGRSWGFLHAD